MLIMFQVLCLVLSDVKAKTKSDEVSDPKGLTIIFSIQYTLFASILETILLLEKLKIWREITTAIKLQWYMVHSYNIFFFFFF